MTESSNRSPAHRESGHSVSEAKASSDLRGTASSSTPSSCWPWGGGGALAVTLSVTILVSAASYAYLRYQRRVDARLQPKTTPSSTSRNNKVSENGRHGAHGPSEKEQEFEVVAGRVRSLRNVPAKERLVLYALYKQATVGDAPPVKGGQSNGALVAAMQEHAKWDAWSRLRGMSQHRAVQMYVELANQLLRASSSGPTATSSAEASQVDDEDDDNSEADDVAASGAFGPPKVSQPAAFDDDGDSDIDDEGNDASNQTSNCRKLLSAASTNDVEAMKQLLNKDPALVDVSDGSGQTALHMAADRGHQRAVELLLDEFGANAVAADDDGISVLQAAVIAGHVRVCQALLARGADPDQQDHDGDTPRSCADDDGSAEMRDLFHECC